MYEEMVGSKAYLFYHSRRFHDARAPCTSSNLNNPNLMKSDPIDFIQEY
jgi:hypothetical protein